jgi:hypothetical protein
VAEIKQGSEAVQVLGKLELQANRQYLFQGTLKPGPELPDQMKQGPLLGQPDGQGRFRCVIRAASDGVAHGLNHPAPAGWCRYGARRLAP